MVANIWPADTPLILGMGSKVMMHFKLKEIEHRAFSPYTHPGVGSKCQIFLLAAREMGILSSWLQSSSTVFVVTEGLST